MIVNLVCPYCHVQSKYNAPDEGWLEGACLKCQKPFRTLLATVRAKKSRGSRKFNSRDFDVRVKHNGREELVAFSASGYDDFELRSSDMAAFHYIQDKLHVVQNFTINQYRVVNGPPLGLIGWLIIGLPILAALWWFMSR